MHEIDGRFDVPECRSCNPVAKQGSVEVPSRLRLEDHKWLKA
jgi:hypothetical protein